MCASVGAPGMAHRAYGSQGKHLIARLPQAVGGAGTIPDSPAGRNPRGPRCERCAGRPDAPPWRPASGIEEASGMPEASSVLRFRAGAQARRRAKQSLQ